MSALETYIKSYFGVIDSQELEKITALFQLKSIAKNDFVLRAGHRCDQMCFVQSGLLRMFIQTEGKEITQWISSSGYFALDLSSFIFDIPAKLSIQALTDSEIFTISKKDYNSIGLIVPQWHVLEKLFLVRCFAMMEERIFSHLSMTAEERYDLFFKNNSELFNQVPLQYIASMLGMTPETFSRIRKKQIS